MERVRRVLLTGAVGSLGLLVFGLLTSAGQERCRPRWTSAPGRLGEQAASDRLGRTKDRTNATIGCARVFLG